MADIPTVPDEHASPVQDDLVVPPPGGNGTATLENRGTKRQRMPDEEDDEDDKTGRERRKIEIKFIQDKSRRHITFSKRKAGIMKKVGRPPSLPSFSLLGWSRRIYLKLTCLLGLRAVCSHRHPGPPLGRVGDWPRLHFHNPKTPTVGNKARGQEPDSSTYKFTSSLD